MRGVAVPAPDPVRLIVPKAYSALAPCQEPSAEVAESIPKFAAGVVPAICGYAGWSSSTFRKNISGKIRRVDLRRRDPGEPEVGPTGEWR
jgi:acetyl-CoA synthetase